jgi:hypothetical protein
MCKTTDFTRLYALTDEMKYSAQNKGLDERALRAQLVELRSKINRELAAIVVTNTRIE